MCPGVESRRRDPEHGCQVERGAVEGDLRGVLFERFHRIVGKNAHVLAVDVDQVGGRQEERSLQGLALVGDIDARLAELCHEGFDGGDGRGWIWLAGDDRSTPSPRPPSSFTRERSSLSSPGALGEWPSPQDASSSVMATVTTRGRMDCNRERFIGCLALKVIVCTCATPQARSDVTRPSEHQR